MAGDNCVFGIPTLAIVYCVAALQRNVKPERKSFYTLFSLLY